MADAYDDLRPASFRGVAFHARRASRRFGRRVDHRERPYAEQGSTVDLGAKDGQISIDAFVLGSDAAARRDDLERALNTKGPGLLVHPWRGDLQAQVLDVDATEDAESIGVADFRITFIEAKPAQPVRPRIDTSRQLELQSETAIAASAAQFQVELETEETGVPIASDAEPEVTLGDQIKAIVGAGAQAARQAHGPIDAVGGFVGDALSIAGTVQTLIGTPSALTQRLLSYFNQLGGLLGYGGTGQGSVRAAAVAPSGSSRQVEALEDFVDQVLVAEEARAVANAETGTGPLVTADGAVDVRRRLTADANRVAENASDKGAGEVTASYQQLAGAVYTDVTERLGQLPRLKPVQPLSTTSLRALVYAESGTLDRYPETLTANGLAHPAFVPSGRKTMVVEDG